MIKIVQEPFWFLLAPGCVGHPGDDLRVSLAVPAEPWRDRPRDAVPGKPAGAETWSAAGGSAPDADSGRRKRDQSLLPDPLAAALAPVILVAAQPFGRPVEIVEVSTGLRQQGQQLGPLERDRRAFRVVLVVIGRPVRRLDDGIYLPRQRRDPKLDACSLGCDASFGGLPLG